MATKAKAKTKRKTTAKKKTTARKKPAVKAKSKAKKKTTARKTTARKTTARKAAPKRKTAAKKTPAKKVVARKKPLTKSGVVNHIVDDTGLTRAQVASMLDSLSYAIECQIGPKAAAGHFTIPGLCKVVRTFKPAKKARKGINPFTGEEAMFKAKPAHYVVKVRALKKLKDMVQKTK